MCHQFICHICSTSPPLGHAAHAPRSSCPPLPPPLRFSQPRGGWNDGSAAADKVRRQEQQVLSAWTSERGMQLAAGGTIVLVLLLLFAAGGPPSDARCTLPWC